MPERRPRTPSPEGRTRSYARLLFFLPSLLYWPSSIGKEAWMMFTLGLAAYAVARLLTGRAARGLVILGGSLWLATQVRPHYAGLLAIAAGIAYLFRRPSEQWRQIAPLAKGVSLAALVVLSGFLVVRTQEFMQRESLTGVSDIQAVLEDGRLRTRQGGSRFEPINLLSPTGPPLAVLTVLFRPLPIEANSATAAIAALEGAVLFALSLLRWRWLLAAFRSFRRQPYVAFAAAYALAGIAVLSSIANFGILTRERVLICPAYLALPCIPPATRRRARATERRVEHGVGRESALLPEGSS